MNDIRSGKPAYCILHISDMHRSSAEPVTNAELVSTLCNDIERGFAAGEPPIRYPDALIVSGDIVQGLPLGAESYPDGLVAQYVEAHDLLVEIANQFFNGDRSRIVLIPGNHDVDWNMAYSAMEKTSLDPGDVYKKLTTPGSPYRWCWKDLSTYKIKDVALYAQRFKYFNDFYRNFYNGLSLTFPVNPERAFNLFELDSGRILICGFNSCEAIDCFNDVGELTGDSIAKSYLEIRSKGKQYSLLSALWHHSAEGPPKRSDYLDAEVVRLLIDRGFQIGLHGHHHKPDARPHTIYHNGDRSMSVVSAGSLCAGSSDIPPGNVRQYNVIEIAEDYSGARIHVREIHNGVVVSGKPFSFGGKSYIDIKWPGPVTAAAKRLSGSAAIALVDVVEQHIRNKQFDLAIGELTPNMDSLDGHGRRLMAAALFGAGEWKKLTALLASPRSQEELSQLVTAHLKLREWDSAGVALAAAKTELPDAAHLVKELERRVAAEKELVK